MPPNDVRPLLTKIFIRDAKFVGVRLVAERVSPPGTLINPEQPLTGSPDDNGDPPLLQPLPSTTGGIQTSSTCPDRTVAQANPANSNLYPTRTVWYELTQNETGAPFGQRFLVTVDSGATNFPSSLAVYRGLPSAFSPGVSALPTNVVACDTNITSGIVPSQVSFVAIPGQRYFLEAGVAPGLSSSGTSLRLAMRILDVMPPTVTVRLNDASADVQRDVFTYTVSPDQPASLSLLHLTQVRN